LDNKFERQSEQTIQAMVSVTSQPLNSNATQMRVLLKDADINTEMLPIIFVEIRKGRDAVNETEVMATINRPNGTEIKMKFKNYNKIYCNYFTISVVLIVIMSLF
jgi:hypothetical protein